MNKKIKFAVVGFGHIGKRHADLIVKNADAELAAISILPHPIHSMLHRHYNAWLTINMWWWKNHYR